MANGQSAEKFTAVPGNLALQLVIWPVIFAALSLLLLIVSKFLPPHLAEQLTEATRLCLGLAVFAALIGVVIALRERKFNRELEKIRKLRSTAGQLSHREKEPSQKG